MEPQPSLTLTLTAILSGIALVASVLSPLLIAIFNNRHQRKMFELDFYARHRAEVIERYLAAAGAAVRFLTPTDAIEFGRCAGEIYAYVPDSLYPILDRLSNDIATSNRTAAQATFKEVAKALAQYSPRGEKQNRG